MQITGLQKKVKKYQLIQETPADIVSGMNHLQRILKWEWKSIS